MLVEYTNQAVVLFLILVFSVYVSNLTTDYPDLLHDMVDEPLFKLICILTLIYISTKNYQIGLLLSMIFIIMINNIPLLSEIDIDSFVNGPALTDCKAYDVSQIKKTGTAYYPIN